MARRQGTLIWPSVAGAGVAAHTAGTASCTHTCVVGSPIDCAATVPTTSPGAAMAFMNLERRHKEGRGSEVNKARASVARNASWLELN